MATLNLVSPWVDYYHKLQAFFKNDEEVTVIFDDVEMEVKLYVCNAKKAEALEKLLCKSRKFGKTTLNITIIPANDIRTNSPRTPYNCHCGKYVGTPTSSETQQLFIEALRDNTAFCFSHVVSGVFTNDLIYIVFTHSVVQYYNDNLSDYFGQCSTLYQNIAADIFEPIDGVFFCTNKLYDPD